MARPHTGYGALKGMTVKLDGKCVVGAARLVVWEVLNDPVSLKRLLPGCTRFVQMGGHAFEVSVTIGVAAVKSAYIAQVRIENRRAPESYDITLNGKGTGGIVRGTASIVLSEQAGATEVSVAGNGQVGGLIAAVGHRLLSTASQIMLAEFFRTLDLEVTKRQGPNRNGPASPAL